MNTLMKIIWIILIVIISAIVFSLTGLAIALILGIAIAIIVALLIFSLIKTVMRLVLILGVILAVVFLLMRYSPFDNKINPLSCKQDSDCICGGIDIKTGQCFIGNKDYYAKFVDKNATCPDFCTGIAGNGQTKCINNKCQNLFNQTR